MAKKILKWFTARFASQPKNKKLSSSPFNVESRLMRRGHAMRVIFFYPGEEGTYIDHAEVSLFENGTVHIQSNMEETTTHLKNCEILWRYEESETDDRSNKVRLLKPKAVVQEKEPELPPRL